MFRLLSFLVSTLLFTPVLSAEPFWGSKASRPINTAPSKLRPGQFIWQDTHTSDDQIKAVINISEQRIYLYRNTDLIGVSTISTGRGRRSTPTGTFTVLGKNRYHRSKKYHNAPMPYTHWLTDNGIAMHAGNLPGYAASHGCIRLPTRFAHFLFESSSIGMPVLITKNSTAKASSATALLTVDNHAEKVTLLSNKKSTFIKPEKVAAIHPIAKPMAEMALIDAEIEKTQAQLNKIKQELASIEQRARK